MHASGRERPQETKRELLIVAVLIVMAFGAFSAEQLWTALKTRPAPPTAEVSTPAAAPKIDSTPAAPIASPAGNAVVDPSVAKLGTDDLGSKRPRVLVLVDTTPGRNSREGSARLGTNPRNPQTYSAGAVLLNGARLAEIHSDYVVLERNNESVRLYLQGKQPRGAAPVSDLLEVGGSSSSQPTFRAELPDAGANAPSVTEFIRPNPVFENEMLKGFALYPGNRSGAFYKSGLAAGDVLIELNGVPAIDAAQVMGLLQQWVSGAALNATVQRGRRTKHITLDGTVPGAEGM